jgi:XTP/dITP diphosphohydrolase
VKLVLATHNPNKIREMSEILSQNVRSVGAFEILTLDELGVTDDVEENGTTFEENALIKARVGASLGYLSVADDSGLEVDALGGEPGVYSARYSGEHGNDEGNNRLVLTKLSGVPTEKRSARFVAAIACVFPDGRSFTVRGTVEGRILEEAEGENGFGYDPIFYSNEAECSFGVYPPEEKNKISHRARALRLFCEKLTDYIGETTC